MERIPRIAIQNAPYNPRMIDDNAAKKLRAVLKEQGLVSPLTWNKTTGNLVGGHQRLAALDILEKSTDYLLDVAVVEVDEKREKELNIILNNPAIQGFTDIDKFALLIPEIDVDAVGYDVTDYQAIFMDTPHEHLFAPTDISAAAAELVRDVVSVGQMTREPGKLANGETIRDPAKLERMNEKRAEMKERIANDPLADEDSYLIVVCPSHEHAGRIRSFFDVREGKYLDGRAVAEKLGL